jgi:hypothetical protein
VNTNVVAASVSSTALRPIPALVGSNDQPVAKVFTTSTVPAAPTYFRPLVTKESTSTNPSWLAAIALDFDRTCTLSPGTAIIPQQTAADTTRSGGGLAGIANTVATLRNSAVLSNTARRGDAAASSIRAA